MTQPPIGTRVRVTESSLGVKGWMGVVASHHADGVAVGVELGAQRPSRNVLVGETASRVLLDPSGYEVQTEAPDAGPTSSPLAKPAVNDPSLVVSVLSGNTP